MMKLIRCALLSMLLVVLTTTTMSAPQDFSQSAEESGVVNANKDDNRRRGGKHQEEHRGNKGEGDMRRQRTIIIQWRTGTTVPKPNNYMQYEIDHTQYPKLSAPSRYQQWIKVDDHFILVNVVTNTILKVIPIE